MPCSINFSEILQTEILSTGTSDFLKQMIIFKSFNSMLNAVWLLKRKGGKDGVVPLHCNIYFLHVF